MTDMKTLEYLFDLQGFLLIENVLDTDEVATLNRLLDEKLPQGPGLASDEVTFGSAGSGDEGAGFLEWGKPFCDLLDHPRIMPILRFILGDGFRIDHLYGIHMREGTGGLDLHGGATPVYTAPEMYDFRQGKIYCGLSVVSWSLADTGPEHGGFLCAPGSHKSNYPIPEEIMEAHYKAGCVLVPEARAGSVIIFSEALSHGTMPWKAKHQRRSLLFKYDPAHMAYSGRQAGPPESVELTPRQRLLFSLPSAPGSMGRPSLFEPEYWDTTPETTPTTSS